MEYVQYDGRLLRRGHQAPAIQVSPNFRKRVGADMVGHQLPIAGMTMAQNLSCVRLLSNCSFPKRNAPDMIDEAARRRVVPVTVIASSHCPIALFAVAESESRFIKNADILYRLPTHIHAEPNGRWYFYQRVRF